MGKSARKISESEDSTMKEKAKAMNYAELPHSYDAYQHLIADFHGKDSMLWNPDVFEGLGTGKRSDAVQASLFDCIHAEILGEHNAEKTKARRQRQDARKHKELPKDRKHKREMRKDRLYGYYYNENCPKVMFCPDSLPIRYRRDAEAEAIIRADFEMELEDHENAIALYNDFVGMAIFSEHMAEIDMGLEQEKFHVKNMVEGDLRDARECRKMAQEILKGECY